MRLRLFPKYAVLITVLVIGLLAISWAVSLKIAHEESVRHLRELQEEKADLASARIGQFIRDIELQFAWVGLLDDTDSTTLMHARRFELLKLLKHLPQLSEVIMLDASGNEQIYLSRTQLDRWKSGTNQLSVDGVKDALTGKSILSKPFFQRDSEPHMHFIFPLAGGGAVIADINLKLIWNAVAELSNRGHNVAYVVDGEGTLIAHPEIELVLRKLSFKSLPQVVGALNGITIAEGLGQSGQPVLAAFAKVPGSNWLVFVETPMSEIRAELNGLIEKATMVLILGLLISMLLSYQLARRLISPIHQLRDGVARISQGERAVPIQLQTNDELEQLADEFNRMSGELHKSYSALERKVAERTSQVEKERAKVTELLNNMLPQSIAAELADTGKVIPRQHESASIVFSDFSGFTQTASTMPVERMVEELNLIFEAFDSICDECGIERIKTIGDSYMAVGGIPVFCTDHAQRCVRAGLRMIRFLEERNTQSAFKWALRIGVHSGPVVSGVVGKRKYAFDVWGDTVNLASRMESSGEAGRVNVSAYTYDLVKSAFKCEYRGKVSAKGKGDVDMYFVVSELADRDI